MTAELRVLSYNVRSLRDDPAAVAAVIRTANPDVVCVQEAPRFAQWRTRCARLARESGLVIVTGGRRAGAVLLLAALRVRVTGTREVLLTRTPRLHQRGLAVAVLEVAGASYAVASMHLGLDPAERRRHVDEVLYQLADVEPPLVLAGDVNEEPGWPAWRTLAARMQDAYAVAGTGDGATFSARRPRRRIDAIFVDHRLEVATCEALAGPAVGQASDHRPVLAVVRPAAVRRSGSQGPA